MAEPLFDRSSAIPKGRYVAPLNLGATRLAPGQSASTFSNAIPLARMSRGQIDVTQGADALRAAQGMGMGSAPVAMSMKGLREAHAAGLLGSGQSVENFSRKQEIRHSGGAAALVVKVDMRDMLRMADQLAVVSGNLQRGHQILAMAINDGVRKLQTELKRKLQSWTGVRQQARITQAMRQAWASSASLTGQLAITDRHMRITGEAFGAKWSRANPGGTHNAWNRPQLAVGSFMIQGHGKIRSDLLFKRVGKGRYPIAPLWGPSLPREVDRHRSEVQRDLDTVVRTRVLATAERLLRDAIARAAR